MPLIDTLTKGGRAAFPFIQALANGDLSSSQIAKQVKEAGFSVRNQSIYDIVAALRDNQSSAQYLRSLSNHEIPNPAKFGTAVTELLRNYSYKVTVRGRNPDTGESQNRQITVSTNSPLSKDQVLAMASTITSSGTGSDVDEITSIEITDALKSSAL